jgi:hypothetical protein
VPQEFFQTVIVDSAGALGKPSPWAAGSLGQRKASGGTMTAAVQDQGLCPWERGAVSALSTPAMAQTPVDAMALPFR